MTNFEAVKLAVWDLDGTIINSHDIYNECIKEVADAFGRKEPSDETIRLNYHGKLDASIGGVLDVTDQNELRPMVDAFLELQHEHYQNPADHLYPDALRLAQKLSGVLGIEQIVVTNREHAGRGTASPRYLIEHTDMSQYIKEVVSGDDVRFNKPDARVLQGNWYAMGILGPEIVTIGDQFVDAQLAANLKASSILVNRGSQPIAHLDQLDGKIGHITQVKSLDEVVV